MKVKELIKQLEVLNPNAEVMVIAETGEDNGYQVVLDCEEEFSDLVTIGCGYPVYTKERVVKAIKENNKDLLDRFECFDIGQGYGYKSNKEWDSMKLDDVIYIPEAGYAEQDTGVICKYPIQYECVYSKQDFIDIVKDYVKPSRVEAEAQALFNMVDWQIPEVLADELDFDSEYDELYYVFDLEKEEKVGKNFPTLEEAEKELCLCAGIMTDGLTDYLQSSECMYEVRCEENNNDKAFDHKITCIGCKSKCKDAKTGKPVCEEVAELCENITWCPIKCGKY